MQTQERTLGLELLRLTKDEKKKEIWKLLGHEAEARSRSVDMLMDMLSDEQLDQALKHLKRNKEHDSEE